MTGRFEVLVDIERDSIHWLSARYLYERGIRNLLICANRKVDVMAGFDFGEAVLDLSASVHGVAF
jgi:hypothetical protein